MVWHAHLAHGDMGFVPMLASFHERDARATMAGTAMPRHLSACFTGSVSGYFIMNKLTNWLNDYSKATSSCRARGGALLSGKIFFLKQQHPSVAAESQGEAIFCFAVICEHYLISANS
ncbi:hypothetical protein A3J34_01595 [Candidatus Peribacteria bacterium RIFCSPLOWO2_02_FULL_51_10]|nr:MAG: hypothetical protein A3J34_01595 [Candidatus Peribacteria bacterium RIFCSPLOWO2_02_FULL_51_10]